MERLTTARQKYAKSLLALERSLTFFLEKSKSNSQEELENAFASLIKHFEMCYEMAWKFLQSYLKNKHSIEIASPKGVFRESFVMHLISESETKQFLDMAEARNATTHDYNEETAKEIGHRISNYYDALKLLERISI